MGTDVYLLVEQLKKKDPKALEQAMDLYMDSVYRLAAGILRNTGSTMDIEECVQDVFIDAWNLIDQYDPERGSFRTWLLILCKYKALNRRRSLADKARVVELKDFTEDSKPAGSDDIEYLYLVKEQKAELLEVILSFGDVDRAIFLRRYLLDESIDDICRTMGLSRQAVDNRLWRGRRAIRELLGKARRRDING